MNTRLLISIPFLWALALHSACAQSIIDSIWAKSDSITSDTSRINYLRQTAYYLKDSRPTDAIRLLDKLVASDFYEEANHHPTVTDFYYGELLILDGKYEKAEEYLLGYIDHWEESKSPKHLGSAYFKLADLHRLQMNYEEGLKAALEAVKYFEAAKMPSYYVQSQEKVTSIMHRMGRSEEAITKNRELLLNENLDSDSRSTLYNGLSVIYSDLGMIDSSLVYNVLYRDNVMKGNNVANQFIANYNLGLAYQHNKQYQKAWETFDIAIQLAKESGVTLLLPYALISKAGLYTEQGHLQKALQLFDSLATLPLAPDQRLLLAQGRYEALKAGGNLAAALPYLEQWKHLSDSLKSVEITTQINELQIKYDTETKVNEITQLSLTNELKTNQVKTQRLGLLGLGTGILLLATLLFDSFRQRKKVSTQNKIIATALHEKEILLKEIHHRVKNNLQMISSLLSLQSRSMDSESATIALEDGQLRVQSMALIHEHLYTDDNVTGVNMQSYVRTLCDRTFAAHNVNQDTVNLVADIADIDLDISTVVPLGLIFNELITNACKHAFPVGKNGKITVRLQEENNNLIVEVSDTGVGQKLEKDSIGFGTKLISTLAKKLDAEITQLAVDGFSTKLTIRSYKKLLHGPT